MSKKSAKITVGFEGVYRATYDVNVISSGKTSDGLPMVVAEVPSLGRTLFIDETLEYSELDKYILQECLILPILALLKENSRVGFIGELESSGKETFKDQSILSLPEFENDSSFLSAIILDIPNHIVKNEEQVISYIDKYIPKIEKHGAISINSGSASIFSREKVQKTKEYLDKYFPFVATLTFPMRSNMGLWSTMIGSSKDPFLQGNLYDEALRGRKILPKFLTQKMYKNTFSTPEYLNQKEPSISLETKTVGEITEPISDGITGSYDVVEFLEQGETPYQKYSIANIKGFGKTLFIEPQLQSALIDEYIYHECLVHPAMSLCPTPKKVMIAGGGEGATLRDVLKHPSVEKAWMIDIDTEIVEMSKKHLPEWHQGAFDNPKAVVECTDARKWIEKAEPSSFDLIISDLSEPTEGGPSAFLFTTEFYTAVYKALTDEGIFVLQAGTADISQPECFACCIKTLQTIFPIVRPYQAHVTSFLGPWAYVLASKVLDPLDLSGEDIKSRLSSRKIVTNYYTPAMHERIFDMPPYIEDEVSKRARVLTDANPFKW